MPAPIASAAGYGAHATALSDIYESLTFARVHRGVLHLFPTRASDVLDIGAGSGRDAAALAQRGHRVVAVEPTAELRSEGQRRHASLPIEWIDDHLPTLATLRRSPHQQQQRRFDLILLTAVWMHLDETERRSAMETIASLLERSGLVSMSLRHGPVPPGRRMFDVSAEETIELGAQFGLHGLHRCAQDDAQGRPDVHWSFVVLRRD